MTTDIDAAQGAHGPPQPDGRRRLELPFTWEDGPATAEHDDRDTVFRLPAADDPRPGSRRLLAMSLYASVLGTVILAVAAYALVSSVAGSPGGRSPALLPATWLSSVVLVIGAFLSIHRRRLPWVLLLASTLPLTATVVITVTAG